MPGLPSPDSAEALARGLVRVDRRGQADGPAYHPLHPEVREALKRRVAEADRALTAQELADRVCAAYDCPHEPHLEKAA